MIHLLVGLPNHNQAENISAKLGLSLETVRDCLHNLEMANLILKEGGVYKISTGQLHLSPNNPLVKKHHINWRLQTMKRLSDPKDKDLHYTSVISCSHKDKEKVRDILADAVAKIRAVIKNSPDETLCHYSIDYFEI